MAADVLIHIGYQKTATSWLQRHLFGSADAGFGNLGKTAVDHPIRRLIAARPLEFDAAAWRAEFDPLLTRRWEKGLEPVLSFERLSGHPFAGGWDAKEIADRLYAVFPEARVLIVSREQRSMLVSAYKQYVRAGGPCNVSDFLHPVQSKSMRAPVFDLRHYEYEHLLRHYRRLFGSEAVLSLTFEQFARDPRGFAARVTSFAELEPPAAFFEQLPAEERVNPGRAQVALSAKRIANRLAWRSEVHPAPLLSGGERFPNWVEHTMLRLPTPASWSARLERRIRKQIVEGVGDRFVESNRAYAALTGIDLGALGWMI